MYSSKKERSTIKTSESVVDTDKQSAEFACFPIYPSSRIQLCGDFHINVYQENALLADELICRTSFNTSFVPRSK